MAVAKSRKSRSKRNMRRHSHSALTVAALSIDPATGGTHLRHHVGPDGYYKGRQVIDMSSVNAEDQDQEE